MYSEQSGAAQTVTNADGSKIRKFAGVTRITEAARKYLNARGVLRESVDFDAAKNFN
jgi:hypothetical protein